MITQAIPFFVSALAPLAKAMGNIPKIIARVVIRIGRRRSLPASADPTNKKYPIDTPEHVRAAWAYINQKDNAARYEADEVEAIKERVRKAAKKKHIAIRED